MSSEAMMTMTCSIQRATVSTDSGGGEDPSWANIATGVPCRVWQLQERERHQGVANVVVTHKAVFPYRQDVTEKDRLTNVASADGTALFSVADIESVDPDAGGVGDHLEVNLKEVRTF